MATSYPGGIDAFTSTRADNSAAATQHAADHNDTNAALVAIETELGVNPSGAAPTVAARLNSALPIDAVADYGADNTGTADAGTALASAIAAALSTDRPLHLSAGVYKITAALDMRGDGIQVIGDGKYTTVIRQFTSNTPGVLLGGQHQRISGFTVDYNTTSTSAHTNANAFEFYLSFLCEFTDLGAWRSARGLFMPAGATNNVFSCVFRTIQVNGYAISAIDFVSTGSYSTGNVWQNIYLHNNFLGPTDANSGVCVRFAFIDEMVIQQMNIEWTNPADDVIVFQQVKNCTIDGLHFEQVGPTGAGRGFLRLYDQCKLQLRSMSTSFNTIGASLGTWSAFRIGGGNVFLECTGFNRNTNTVSTSGTTYTLVAYDSPPTNGSVRIVQAEPQDFAQITSGDSTSLPNFKELNTEYTDPLPPRTGPAGRIFNQTSVKVENMPRWGQALTTQATLVSGTIRVFPIGVLRAYEQVSALQLVCSATASGAPTNSWGGIARLSDRVILAISATSTANPATNATKTFTFGTAYTPTEDVVAVAFVMYQVTTPPAFYGINQVNTLFLSTPVINGTSGTGQTTPPAAGTTLAAFTVDTEVLYGQLT